MSNKNVLNENKEAAVENPEKTQNETPPEFQGKSDEERRESDLSSDTISEQQARTRNASAAVASAPAAQQAGDTRYTNVEPDTSGSIDRGAINADAAGVPADASQDHRTEEEKTQDVERQDYESRNADVDPNSPVQPGSKDGHTEDGKYAPEDADSQQTQQSNTEESDKYSPEYDGTGERPSEQQDSSETKEENKNQ